MRRYSSLIEFMIIVTAITALVVNATTPHSFFICEIAR